MGKFDMLYKFFHNCSFSQLEQLCKFSSISLTASELEAVGWEVQW